MQSILAQNMPGMEWIPLLLLAPGSGLLLGVRRHLPQIALGDHERQSDC